MSRMARRCAPNLSGEPASIPGSRSPCTMWPCLRVCVYERQLCVYLLQSAVSDHTKLWSSDVVFVLSIEPARVLSAPALTLQIHILHFYISRYLESGLIQRLQHSIRNIRIDIGWRYINVCILRSFKEIFYDYSTSNIDSNIQKVEVFSCLIPKVLVVLHIMMLHFLVCPKNAH